MRKEKKKSIVQKLNLKSESSEDGIEEPFPESKWRFPENEGSILPKNAGAEGNEQNPVSK